MKIRNGFVSNSSSSSFIVQIEDNWFIKEGRPFNVDKEKISLLEEYGFTKTSRNTPLSFKERTEDEEEQHYMHYSVSCNEDDVMAFLMKNNIPFKASCHYDHYYIMMKKDADLYIYASNFGNEIDMYGFAENDVVDWQEMCRQPKIEMRSVQQFIRDNPL